MVFETRFIFACLVFIVLCYTSFNLINGSPVDSLDPLDTAFIDGETGHSITARATREGCSNRGGCWKGYCWVGCEVFGGGKEWCYTTKSHSQSHKYISCSRDSECNKCSHCGGGCTV